MADKEIKSRKTSSRGDEISDGRVWFPAPDPKVFTSRSN